jgi:hypothetical protein
MTLTLTSARGADNGYIPSQHDRFRLSSVDYRPALCDTAPMLRSCRKSIAVLMLMWLPIFTGSALAASVLMLLPHGGCNDAAMSEAMDMGEHPMHHDEMPAPAGDHSTCGVCHLACTGYLTVPGVAFSAAHTAAREFTPYLVVFDSVTSTPLLPPPLVRA